MKVSSPIGELPFEPKRMRLRRSFIEVEGLMGAWPARVEIGLGDIPSILRLLAVPLIIAGVVIVVVATVLVVVLVPR